MENKELKSLVDKLEVNQSLAIEEYVALIEGYSPSLAQYAAQKALQKKEQFYGNKVSAIRQSSPSTRVLWPLRRRVCTSQSTS